jgi:hypothetical protein
VGVRVPPSAPTFRPLPPFFVGRGSSGYTRDMTATRFLAVLLAVAVLAMVVQPARAEALEPNTVLMIAGAAVAAVMLAVIVVIGVTRDRERGETSFLLPDQPDETPVLLSEEGGDGVLRFAQADAPEVPAALPAAPQTP